MKREECRKSSQTRIMQVVFHTGAHCTDEDRLLKCLLRNKQDFSQRGIAVPGPSRYRDLLGQTFRAMENSDPAPDARAILIDAFLDDETADRMILSNAFFFGSKRIAVEEGQIYANAPQRVAYLRQLFPTDRLEMFMALRNPASFLPAVLSTLNPNKQRQAMGGLDPRNVRWSNCLNRIREAVPDVELTIWCNEDTPLIWDQIIREMAGLEHGEQVVGEFDLLSDIMSAEGMQRFTDYIQKHPKMTDVQKRRVISAFLDKFAIEDELEEELDLPGWTDELVEDMTEIYDEDVFRIQRIPGINLIMP